MMLFNPIISKTNILRLISPRMVIGCFYRRSAGGLLRQEVMLVLILRLLLRRSLVTARFGRTRG